MLQKKEKGGSCILRLPTYGKLKYRERVMLLFDFGGTDEFDLYLVVREKLQLSSRA